MSPISFEPPVEPNQPIEKDGAAATGLGHDVVGEMADVIERVNELESQQEGLIHSQIQCLREIALLNRMADAYR